MSLGAVASKQAPNTTSDVLNVVFHCEGSENSLLDCSTSIITSQCSTGNDQVAAIQCGGMKSN